MKCYSYTQEYHRTGPIWKHVHRPGAGIKLFLCFLHLRLFWKQIDFSSISLEKLPQENRLGFLWQGFTHSHGSVCRTRPCQGHCARCKSGLCTPAATVAHQGPKLLPLDWEILVCKPVWLQRIWTAAHSFRRITPQDMLNAAPLRFTGTILNWSTSAAHLNLLVND